MFLKILNGNRCLVQKLVLFFCFVIVVLIYIFLFFPGPSHEENQRKMRLLTFMQMCENRKEMDFGLIQDEMQLDKDEVEEFIIDGNIIHYNTVKPNLKGLAILLRFKDSFDLKKAKIKKRTIRDAIYLSVHPIDSV